MYDVSDHFNFNVNSYEHIMSTSLWNSSGEHFCRYLYN